ncbi:MAG: type II toxin-antitoxin system antitoxin, RelB/DinJ family [Syntrophobacterales bacterium CG23_combo_of_CG06-09_8_20_14_all_48_27]|nr:MAG: type II toxin-antitoxin system antitoxin, RelB/DinJ family [Syntrophobacterales bacterium CG23_combo_of_CG06-09_8_20_14_all_48_27]
MAKTALISARTERDLKEEVEVILKALGLSTTEAINIFFRQVKMRKGLPFPVEIPNEETLKTFRDSEAGKGLIECKDVDDMFKKLGI